MCGIVGYVGHKSCSKILFDGLKHLEYRGYDSAGIAVLDAQQKISLIKAEGKLHNLEPQLELLPQEATIGIGHTRWATHGPAVVKNAHPHVVEQKLAIVHNGIIENYADLRAGLEAAGKRFETDTDTEVVLLLLHQELSKTNDIKKALCELVAKLKGAFSLGVLWAGAPESLYLVKQGSPMVLGLGEQENLFASDVAALVSHTQRAIFLEDGDMARLTAHDYEIWNFMGEPVEREIKVINWSAEQVEKQGFAHYMLKEIHEQPWVLRRLIEEHYHFAENKVCHESMGWEHLDLGRVKRIHIVACGTAYYAGLVGGYLIESIARIPVHVELASEFRYRQPYVDEDSFFIAISQSGETMDTLESLKFAKRQGAQTYCICNVPYSSITREAHGTLLMHCGPEIGVASTKAFTAMVVSEFLVALSLAELRGISWDFPTLKEELKSLPIKIEAILAKQDYLRKLAEKYFEHSSFLYIGRGYYFAIALEGALKLKEISYIHAEAYAGGELKHGPIALIDQNMPVLALAPSNQFFDKMVTNIEQVVARHGRVLVVGNESGQAALKELCDDFIVIPTSTIEPLEAVIAVVPLQLFAYYMALLRGTDVDQPRNLAKSVTVE